MEAGGELRDGVLTYVGGVSADGDLIVKSCLGPIQAGWKIVLKLRRTPSKGRGQAPKDDLCVWMPGVQQPFRSMAQLARSAGQPATLSKGTRISTDAPRGQGCATSCPKKQDFATLTQKL